MECLGTFCFSCNMVDIIFYLYQVFNHTWVLQSIAFLSFVNDLWNSVSPCQVWKRENLSHRTVQYSELEVTHKNHQVQLLDPHRITQISDHMTECTVLMILELWHLGFSPLAWQDTKVGKCNADPWLEIEVSESSSWLQRGPTQNQAIRPWNIWPRKIFKYPKRMYNHKPIKRRESQALEDADLQLHSWFMMPPVFTGLSMPCCISLYRNINLFSLHSPFQLCWPCGTSFRACCRVRVLCSFVKQACSKAQRV